MAYEHPVAPNDLAMMQLPTTTDREVVCLSKETTKTLIKVKLPGRITRSDSSDMITVKKLRKQTNARTKVDKVHIFNE